MTSDSYSGLRALLVPVEQTAADEPPTRASCIAVRHRRCGTLGRRATHVGREGQERRRRQRARRSHAAEALRCRLLATSRERSRVAARRGVTSFVCFHRLEARGEIRGGRFIAGLSGEQFALPEAVAALRAIRNKQLDGQWIAVCGADPLNLVGSLLAGTTIPAVSGSRVLYRDGVPGRQTRRGRGHAARGDG